MRAAKRSASVSAVFGGIVLAACVSAGAELPRSDASFGFESTFGATSPALSSDVGALFLNPAALTRAKRASFWTMGELHGNGEMVRVGALHPTTSGIVLGLGLTRERLDAAAPGLGTRRRRMHLGSAWEASRAWTFGANLQLLSQEDETHFDTSFGVDLGVRWAWARRGTRDDRPTLSAGVAVTNAVEPRVLLQAEAVHEPRTWTAGLAWTPWRRGAWATTMASGIQAPRNSRRTWSYVARAATPRGVQFALGVHDARLRAGASVAWRAWTVGYAVSDVPDGTAHGVNLQLGFGVPLETKRIARVRERELEFASRFVTISQERDAARLLKWRREAETALALGQFERAASLYRVLLEAMPGDSRATDGLLHARHAALLREADSLFGQHDRAGAVRALERAIALTPDDSVSVQRLQKLQLAARDATRTRSEVSRQFNAGIDAYARQDYRAAVAKFTDVLKLDPQHPEATSYREQAVNSQRNRVRSALNQARTRLEAGEFDAARRHVRRALQSEPGQKEALRLMTHIDRAALAAQREAARQQKAQEDAQVVVARGEDAAPQVPVAQVQERYDSGLQQYRSGKLMAAMQTWEEVAQLAPHFEEVDEYLQRVYRVTGLESYTEGRLRDAVDIWQKALQLEPDNTQLRRYLNRAQAKLARAQSVDPGR